MPMDLDELVEHWTLLEDERQLVAGKRGATRLGFALLLKFYAQRRRPRAGAATPTRREEPVNPRDRPGSGGGTVAVITLPGENPSTV
jgi:hypothetical protein